MRLHPATAFRAFWRELVSGRPAPTFDELAAQFNRFISERAPLFPEEAVLFAGFVTDFAKGLAPMLAPIGAAAAISPSSVSAPPSTDSAPTGEQLLASLHRFFAERAPAHPLEAMTVAAFLAGLAKTVAPQVAAMIALFPDSAPTPSKPPSTDGEVN